MPAARPSGRPEEYPKREIVNAILYVLRTGGAWCLVPHDLPPWGMSIIPFGAGVVRASGNASTIPYAAMCVSLQDRNRQLSVAIIDSSRSNSPPGVAPQASTGPSRSKGASGISWSIR